MRQKETWNVIKGQWGSEKLKCTVRYSNHVSTIQRGSENRRCLVLEKSRCYRTSLNHFIFKQSKLAKSLVFTNGRDYSNSIDQTFKNLTIWIPAFKMSVLYVSGIQMFCIQITTVVLQPGNVLLSSIGILIAGIFSVQSIHSLVVK